MTMKELGKRIIKGKENSYLVCEAIDAIDGTKFLEVNKLNDLGSGMYEDEYLFDMDGTLSETDTEILQDIEFNLKRDK